MAFRRGAPPHGHDGELFPREPRVEPVRLPGPVPADEHLCLQLLCDYCQKLRERYPQYPVLQAVSVLLEQLSLSLL